MTYDIYYIYILLPRFFSRTSSVKRNWSIVNQFLNFQRVRLKDFFDYRITSSSNSTYMQLNTINTIFRSYFNNFFSNFLSSIWSTLFSVFETYAPSTNRLS